MEVGNKVFKCDAGEEGEVSVTDTKEKEILDTGLSLCHDSWAMMQDILLKCALFEKHRNLIFFYLQSFTVNRSGRTSRFLDTHNSLNGIWPQNSRCRPWRNIVCIRQKMNTLKLYSFINIITDYDAGHKLQCTWWSQPTDIDSWTRSARAAVIWIWDSLYNIIIIIENKDPRDHNWQDRDHSRRKTSVEMIL